MLLHFFEGVYPYIEFAILVQSKLMLVQDEIFASQNFFEMIFSILN